MRQAQKSWQRAWLLALVVMLLGCGDRVTSDANLNKSLELEPSEDIVTDADELETLGALELEDDEQLLALVQQLFGSINEEAAGFTARTTQVSKATSLRTFIELTPHEQLLVAQWVQARQLQMTEVMPSIMPEFTEITDWSNPAYKDLAYRERLALQSQQLRQLFNVVTNVQDGQHFWDGYYMRYEESRSADDWAIDRWDYMTHNSQPRGFVNLNDVHPVFGNIVRMDMQNLAVSYGYGGDGEGFIIMQEQILTDDIRVLWLMSSYDASSESELQFVVKKGHQLYSFAGYYKPWLLSHVIQYGVEPLHQPRMLETHHWAKKPEDKLLLDELVPMPDLSHLPKVSRKQQAMFDVDFFLAVDGSTATYPLTVNAARYFLGLTTSEQGLKHYTEKYKDYEGYFELGDYRRFVPNLERDDQFLQHYGTSSAYHRLIDGKANLILAVAPSEEELAYAQQQGVELVQVPIAYDAFVFMVNEDNPVKQLSVEQIQEIYQGKLTNWQQVGGIDQPIKAFQRDDQSGSQRAMRRLVMQGLPLMAGEPAWVMFGMGDLARTAFPFEGGLGSIGYSYRFYIDQMRASSQHSLKYVAVDGVYPSDEAIVNQTYPFVTGYYAVYRADERDAAVLAFIEWLQSSVGRQVLGEVGYISAGVGKQGGR